MSFAAGIGAGLAVGLGAGIAAGRKRAGDDLRKYIDSRQIIIQTMQGQTISTEEFLTQALQTDLENNKRVWMMATIGLGVLFLVGILAFWIVSNS